MSEFQAHLLVFIGTALLVAACLLGGTALGGRQLGAALSAIVPLVFASQGVVLVIRHYGSTHDRRR